MRAGPGGYSPFVGNSFTVMTYASRSGTFAEVESPSFPTGRTFRLDYNATDLTLTVVEDCNVNGVPDESEIPAAGALFADDVVYSAGDGAFSVAVGDLDGDGDLDLVGANLGSNNVSVLLNNGDGTFAAQVT